MVALRQAITALCFGLPLLLTPAVRLTLVCRGLKCPQVWWTLPSTSVQVSGCIHAMETGTGLVAAESFAAAADLIRIILVLLLQRPFLHLVGSSIRFLCYCLRCVAYCHCAICTICIARCW